MIFNTISPVEQFRTTLPATYLPSQLDPLSYDEITGRAPAPLTMGQEIEQDRGVLDIDFKEYLLLKRHGHHDGSGPFEWDYGPFRIPTQWLNLLYKDMNYPQYLWKWRNKTVIGQGCGSHIHFAVNPEYHRTARPRVPEVELWTCLWNTLNDIAPFLAPLFIHTPRARDSISSWASYVYARKNQVTVDYLLRHGGRGYYFLTFNPAGHNKPVTIEFRAPESHPIFLASFQRIISYGIRQVFKVLVSPKLLNGRGLLQPMMSAIYRGRDVYEVLKSFGPVVFERPVTFFDTPRMAEKRRYRTAYEFFKTLIYDRMIAYPEKQRNKDYFFRALWFVYNEGIAENEPWRNLWRAYVEEDFQWETVPPFTGKIPSPTPE